MSDVDAPYKHTRLSDLKRPPLRKMPNRKDQSDDEQSSSFNSSMDSHNLSGKASSLYPKLTPNKSPSPKKKGVYPNLNISNADDSGSDGSYDVSDDGSLNNTNQSAKSVPSPPGSNVKRRKGGAAGQGQRVRKPPTQSVNEEAAENDTFGVNTTVICIVLLGFAIAIAFYLYPMSNEVVSDDKTPTTVDVFLDNFKQLKKSYPAQDARFWKVIGSQVKRVLSNDSMYPAVILLGIPAGEASLGTCVTKKLVTTLNDIIRLDGEHYIDSVALDQASPAKAKLNLDENLKTIFAGSKGAIIDHVEKLPAKAALLLHGYCDGDNAPYKDVVLFLVLHTGLSRSDLNDKVVEKKLTDLWGSELGVDEMPALCSRIANNIVVLSPEEDETLSVCG